MIWLDAQLSPRVARWIETQFGIQKFPIRDLKLRPADDEAIWRAAKAADAIFMTKDADFSERGRRLGPPPRILWLTCGNTSEDRLKHILAVQLSSARELLRHGEGLVEIQ